MEMPIKDNILKKDVTQRTYAEKLYLAYIQDIDNIKKGILNVSTSLEHLKLVILWYRDKGIFTEAETAELINFLHLEDNE